MYIVTGETVVVVRRDPDQQPIRRGVVAEGVPEPSRTYVPTYSYSSSLSSFSAHPGSSHNNTILVDCEGFSSKHPAVETRLIIITGLFVQFRRSRCGYIITPHFCGASIKYSGSLNTQANVPQRVVRGP